MEKLLVTHALLYANGPMHLGHTLGYVQSDIWVKTQRLLGKTCHYICGDDAHGTPIMINAKKNNMAPEEFIKGFFDEHVNDFNDFNVNFDNYGSTHSALNQELSEDIFKKLNDKGHILTHTIEQAYDEQENMFLPDRFIKGECPKCGTADQYGDSCEHCGATYNPNDLKNPVSVVSGSTPTLRESKHYFFNLPNFTEMLESWVREGHLQEEIKHKLLEWFEGGLKTWDISRDAPYFGFKIPGEDSKYFYVWFDAPIGYISSFQEFCNQNSNVDFNEFWQKNSNTKLVHFIGKDITYFHCLFWPAVLDGADLKKPDHVFVNGFLTVDGKKMSKSRGTFIKTRTYLNHLDSDYLRYYFAAKLGKQVEDFDLNLKDFVQRVNSDLVGKLVNIASRCSGFIYKKFDATLADDLSLEEYGNIYQDFVQKIPEITKHFDHLEYSTAIREIMALADNANQFIDHYKPWVLMKSENQDDKELAHKVCSLGINLFRVLISLLNHIVPNLAQKSADFLNTATDTWQNLEQPLVNHKINKFKPLISRIDPETIDKIIEESKV